VYSSPGTADSYVLSRWGWTGREKPDRMRTRWM